MAEVSVRGRGGGRHWVVGLAVSALRWCAECFAMARASRWSTWTRHNSRAVGRGLEVAGGVLAIPTDVTQEGEVQDYVRRTLDHFGQLDLFFNNAGIEGGIVNSLTLTSRISTVSWPSTCAVCFLTARS
jgi:NAD(P)-dependent dehydrogenase (short-subunit alcohol dehydrogenase family)